MVRLLMLFLGTFAAGIFTFGIASSLLKDTGHTLPPVAGLVVANLSIQVPGLVLIHLFLRAHGRGWRDGFGCRLSGSDLAWAAGTAVLAVVLGYPLQAFSARILQSLGWQPQAQTAVELLRNGTWTDRAIIAAFALVFAPVVEEGLFRGVLYQFGRDHGRPRLALLGTSILFGLAHANAAAFLPLALVGTALGRLYERTGNLGASMTAHALFNLVGYSLAVSGFDPFTNAPG